MPVVRHPKIYVVTEEQHDPISGYPNADTLRLATVDIDQAFKFVQSSMVELSRDAFGLRPYLDVSEIQGELISRKWRCSPQGIQLIIVDAANVVAPAQASPYEHVFGGRYERLIEAAEVIMTMAIEDEPTEPTDGGVA